MDISLHDTFDNFIFLFNWLHRFNVNIKNGTMNIEKHNADERGRNVFFVLGCGRYKTRDNKDVTGHT